MNDPSILARLEGVRKSGSGWTAHCPAHEDSRSSLSVSLGKDERVLVHCHAGCTPEQIVAGVEMTMGDLAPPHHDGNGKPRIVSTYDYRDESGNLLYQAVRLEPKDFRQRRPKDGGGWEWKLDGVRRVPYRLPELLKADPSETVYVVEGEKDCDNLRRLGLTATCNSGGAGKWRAEYNEFLRDRSVVILPDNDEPGRNHAEQVLGFLRGIAAEVKVLELPGLKEHGDVSDWLAAGGTVEALQRLVEQAPLEPAPVRVSNQLDEGRAEIEAVTLPAPRQWPTARPEAFTGLVGEFIRIVSPQTEADETALLLQFLVNFGSVIGRGPCVRVGATWHHANLYLVIVGETSRSRKGTGGDWVRHVFSEIDPEWSSTRVLDGGLSSGEGVVNALRDPDGEDEGKPDKRLLVNEAEFVSVLKVCRRETNILSAILRNGWDGKSLQTLTRNNPLKATRPHLSLVCHITEQELRRALAESDLHGGTANRFLWGVSRRSKLLPEGGSIPNLCRLTYELRSVVEFARSVEVLARDEPARREWRDLYLDFAGRNYTGALAGACSRAEAQTLRVSLLYALLDKSSTIGAEHVRAARAVWDFCESSARLIFGESLGDPLADKALDVIRSRPGISRWELHRELGKHHKAALVVRVLADLRDRGLVRAETQQTEGRAAEVWFPVSGPEVSEERELTEVWEESPGRDTSLTSNNSLTSHISRDDWEEIIL